MMLRHAAIRCQDAMYKDDAEDAAAIHIIKMLRASKMLLH